MRQPRLRGEGLSYYHCMSRVVDRRQIFDDAEKEWFVGIMRKLEAFHGMRVVTYCVMSNHFHLLVEEPDASEVPDLNRETLLERAAHLYDAASIRDLTEELDRAELGGNPKALQDILDRYQERMGDVSTFIKELKQRFTQSYNRRMGRRGTLWEDRFKSVLVEGDDKALMTIAAYIDLNPVRAGIVAKPEDYRWCGYASAVGGNRWARQGLGRILDRSPLLGGDDFEQRWSTASEVYRLWLYDQGEEVESSDAPGAKPAKRGFTQKEIDRVVASGGRFSLKEVLRCRVRYFTDGAVLGGEAFVESVFQRYRGQFGPNRETGPRPMRDADWGGLRTLRDLRGRRLG